MISKFFTPHEVADLLSVNTQTVRKWLREKKLGSSRFGRQYRISESSIRCFSDRCKEEAAR